MPRRTRYRGHETKKKKQWKRCKEESERRGLLLPFCPRCQCTTEKEMISSSPLSFRAISVRVACSSIGCWSALVCLGFKIHWLWKGLERKRDYIPRGTHS